MDDRVLIDWLRATAPHCRWTALQLVIEYDPQPPFASGSPTKADASALRLASRALLGDHPLHTATRLNRHSAAARSRRARSALSRRLATRQS